MKFLKKLQKKFQPTKPPAHASANDARLFSRTNANRLRAVLGGGGVTSGNDDDHGTQSRRKKSRWSASPSTIENCDHDESTSEGDDSNSNNNLSPPNSPNSIMVTMKTTTNLEKRASSGSAATSASSDSESAATGNVDANANVNVWKLHNIDESTTKPQSMEDEMQRLQVLQSYFLLDSHDKNGSNAENNAGFDSIIKLVKLMFAPVDILATISLIDLGRQYVLSGLDTEDMREAPRGISFCAHTILAKKNVLIVEDARKDPRFCNSPFTTTAPYLRSYLGVPLTTPEGYNIGTLCAVGFKDAVEATGKSALSFTTRQVEQLQEMAKVVMNLMVARRKRLIKQEYERRTLELAEVFRSTSASLNGATKQLHHVKQHQDGTSQATTMSRAIQTLTIQSKICAATARTMLERDPEMVAMEALQEVSLDLPKNRRQGEEKEQSSETGFDGKDDDVDVDGIDTMINKQTMSSTSVVHSRAHILQEDLDDILYPTTDMIQLYTNLNRIVSTLSSSSSDGANFTIEFEKGLPQRILAEDLLLFKSCLYMITHIMQMQKTAQGKSIHLRIRASNKSYNDDLIVEACSSNPTELLQSTMAKQMFQQKTKQESNLLHSVSTMVRTMNGTVGFYHGKLDAKNKVACNIFWFKIPMEVPESSASSSSRDDAIITKTLKHKTGNATKTSTGAGRLPKDPLQGNRLIVQ